MKNEPDPLDITAVDLKNPEDRRRFLEAAIKEGSERSLEAFDRLRTKGLIDLERRRVSKELPEDMRPDAKTDVGG